MSVQGRSGPSDERAPSCKRIAFLTASLEGGGAERVLVTLANGCRRAGHAVDLLLARGGGPYLKELDAGVRVIALSGSRTATALIPLARYLRREKPDALLATISHVNVVALLAHWMTSSGATIVVRETIAVSALPSDGSLKSWAVRSLMRRLYRRARWVVAPSQGVATDLAETIGLPLRNIQVIPNPLDIERIRAMAAEPVASSEEPVVLGVGRLTEQKDFGTLIRAFAKVRTSHAARLVILGEGEDRPELEQLIADLGLSHCVDLPGFVTNPFPQMRGAAAFVLSSRYEGLPNGLLQAMALGRPVIATDCPCGPREILAACSAGRLVPMGDVDRMAEAIVDALEHRIATPLSGRVESAYGMEEVTRQYLSVLLGG